MEMVSHIAAEMVSSPDSSSCPVLSLYAPKHSVQNAPQWNNCQYSRTPLVQINLDGEPSRYVENLDNCIFL